MTGHAVAPSSSAEEPHRRSGSPPASWGPLDQLRRAGATTFGTAAGALSRHLGRGGGTSLPGYLAERLDPSLLADLTAALPAGWLAVSGTNGKTTTARILADALRQDGAEPVANREGSNLSRGLVTTLLEHADRWGRPRYGERSVGVFELDEGALPQVVSLLAPRTAPRAVVLTNLFRDQLDRYFELDFLRVLWERGLSDLPAGGGGGPPFSTLVVNADDPQLAYLAESLALPTVSFGLQDLRHAQPAMEHAADARRCPRCEHPLRYATSFYAHLGHYACPACGWSRPEPDVTATRVELAPDSCRLEVERPDRPTLRVDVPLGGLHNAYNALAAAAGAHVLAVPDRAFVDAARSVEGAFGRAERLTLDGRELTLALAKNPSGFNATLRWMGEAGRLRHLVVALNDAGPDGRDVSWIWDVDFEAMPRPEWIICSGRRAYDLALRLEYAGLGVPSVRDDPVAALREGLRRAPEGEPLSVVATYTAMWAIRQALVQEGHLAAFWARPAGTGAADGPADPAAVTGGP